MKVTKEEKKRQKGNKRTALIICRNSKQFWTTQTRFWQWFREGVVVKLHDKPLTGEFVREPELVVLGHTVLNLANPNHLREALSARRIGLARRLRG